LARKTKHVPRETGFVLGLVVARGWSARGGDEIVEGWSIWCNYSCFTTGFARSHLAVAVSVTLVRYDLYRMTIYYLSLVTHISFCLSRMKFVMSVRWLFVIPFYTRSVRERIIRHVCVMTWIFFYFTWKYNR